MVKRGVNGLGTEQRCIIAGISVEVVRFGIHSASDLVMLTAEMRLDRLRLMLKLLHSNLLVSAIGPEVNVLRLKKSVALGWIDQLSIGSLDMLHCRATVASVHAVSHLSWIRLSCNCIVHLG